MGCVSLAGTDYPAAMLDALERRGIDLSGVHRLGRPGVRTWLLYEGHLRRLVHRLGSPTHEEVSPGPEHVPGAWRSAPGFHLSPMPFAVQRRALAALADDPSRFVSVDPEWALPRLAAARLPLDRAVASASQAIEGPGVAGLLETASLSPLPPK